MVQGAEAALQALASVFGKDLLQKLPRLWEHASAAIATNAAAAVPGHLLPPPVGPQVQLPCRILFRPGHLFCGSQP